MGKAKPPNKPPNTRDVKVTVNLPWGMYELILRIREALNLGSLSEAVRFMIAMASLTIESGLQKLGLDLDNQSNKVVKKIEKGKVLMEQDKVYVIPVHKTS